MSTPEFVTLPQRWGVAPRVLLRWGVKRDDLEAVSNLHDAAFPIKYGADYYNWLLSDSCVAVVAYTSPNYIRLIQESNESMELTAAGSTDDAATHDELPCAYSVLVGFCIGQIAYGRWWDGRLMVSPIGYLSSFAVDERMQRRGLGELLLHRFLSYMFFCIPIPREMFLDYSPPNSTTAVLSIWWSTFASACEQIFGQRCDKTRSVTGSKVMGKNGSEKNGCKKSCRSALIAQEHCGLKGVWLHCLASDARLIQYYLKRGFNCVTVDSETYKFDGAYHDGMLLVYMREYFDRGFHLIDSDKEIKRVNATTTTTNNNINTFESIHEFTSMGGETVALESSASLRFAEWDIVDVVLSTDHVQLRHEWKSSVSGSSGVLGHLVPSTHVVSYTIQAMVACVWVMAVIQIGSRVMNEHVYS